MMQNIVRSSELKHVSLLLGALLLVSPVSGQISTFSDSSGNLVFENRTGGTIFNITNNGGVNMEAKEIRNFFEQDKCGNSEAVKKIRPNGSLECVGISEDQTTEGLSETLAVNNTANQSLVMANGDLKLSDDDNSPSSITLVDEIVFSEDGSQTIRPRNYTDGGDMVLRGGGNPIGSGGSAVVNGGAGSSDSYEDGDVILGSKHTRRIGLGTSSPDSFVDIEGGKLDLSSNNITGVSNLEGFFEQNQCASDEAIKTINPDGSYECNSISSTTGTENLSETMRQGNNAGANLNMKDYNITNNGGTNVSVDDNLRVYGNVYTAGADLAEVYSAEGEPAPGTVVKVSDGEKEVEATEARFEDAVGVVSSDPGHVLNSGAEGVRVALEGKVPVRVAPGEEISKGDEVASGKFGMAVACDTGSVSRVSADSSREELAEAINSLTSNQECLRASFGKALNSSENGFVSVKVE